MQTVAETPMFTESAERVLGRTGCADLVAYLAANPQAGDVIPGTGGIRKLRWQAKGKGKRGGARVIYYLFDRDHPVLALLVYGKERPAIYRQPANGSLRRWPRKSSQPGKASEDNMAKARKGIEKDLLTSMAQAVAFAKGARKGYRVHEFTPDDVRLIRAKTKKSQAEFARVYQIPVKTLQKWETGQGKPTGAAATLLRVIDANPRVVEKALERTA